MKNFKEDEMWLKRKKQINSKIYDKVFYNQNPLVSFFNKSGHNEIEKFFKKNEYFENVLEVGAGTGEHLGYINHKYKSYYITDISDEYLLSAKEKYKNKSRIKFEIQDATNLTYKNETFDRLISIYNLEHLPNPHLVLKEWRRVLKKNGTLSISIPLDGGVAWRLGRYLSTKKTFTKIGLDYDYIIAREHINPSYNLISLIKHYFYVENELYFPLRLPFIDINLIYTCNLKLNKKI